MGTITLLAASFAAWHTNALEARQSPYGKIVERNLFQLQGPPIVIVDVPPKPPLRKVTLTGIATILRKPVAFITVEGMKSQLAQSAMLVNGELMDGIEVKSIDERAGVVRILNDGETQILNFEPAKSRDREHLQWSPNTLPSPPPAPQSKVEESLTPEKQTALIELQRIKFEMVGDSASALLPPTELSSNDKNSAFP